MLPHQFIKSFLGKLKGLTGVRQQVSQMQVPLTTCPKPAGSYNRMHETCEMLYVFEHKTEYLSIHGPLWYFDISAPIDFVESNLLLYPHVLYSSNICEILLYNHQLVVLMYELIYVVQVAHCWVKIIVKWDCWIDWLIQTKMTHNHIKIHNVGTKLWVSKTCIIPNFQTLTVRNRHERVSRQNLWWYVSAHIEHKLWNHPGQVAVCNVWHQWKLMFLLNPKQCDWLERRRLTDDDYPSECCHLMTKKAWNGS